MKRLSNPELQAIVDVWRQRCRENHGAAMCADCLISLAYDVNRFIEERGVLTVFHYDVYSTLSRRCTK